jgi:hypothetical protein
MKYGKAIAHVQKEAAANPPHVETLSTEDLHEAVDAISALLKGAGFGAMERLTLNEERKAYRAEIARRARG